MSLAKSFLFCGAILVFVADASAVTMSWSLVGNPGNVPDTIVMTTDGTSGYGAVGYNYRISTYDVTNRQYAEFLNAKDGTGANAVGLYNSSMGSSSYGGIVFNASNANGSKYTVVPVAQNRPVNYVTWYSSIRFANWMNNGQGNGDSESGAYTLEGGTPTPSNSNSIVRNAGSQIVLPSENEWYKAAYYNPSTNSYYRYPTSSNLDPIASNPTALPNHANYADYPVLTLTDVGAYTGTTSPYGAFDMGGNVFQWNEALIHGSFRGARGGAHFFHLDSLLSSNRDDSVPPSGVDVITGFRLAMIPEPSTLALAAFGFIGLAAWGWRRWPR